ncbi:MAG: hypothetical protein ACD_15C00212G0026 [uncultured bacterium]|nr:MAG: hypothetical protein ACD_15C00212G0026 [uncultured bacterium]
MENETEKSANTPKTQTTEATAKKKTSPWVWVAGGCLIIIILSFLTLAFLSWMGYQLAKEAIQQEAPKIQEFKGTLEEMSTEAEKWNQEMQGWEKKSQELRDAMPDPEDMNSKEPVLN